MSPWRGLGAALLLLSTCLAGCAERSSAPLDPAATVEAVLALAGREEPPADRLAALFEPEALASERAALLDTLAAFPELRSLGAPAIHELAGPGDLAAEIEAELAGGGRARFRLRLVAAERGGFHVSWLSGPALEWPPREKDRSLGLSSSEPPLPGDV